MDLNRIRSGIDGSASPLFPTARGSSLLAMQIQLEKTEREPAGAMRRLQNRQIANVVRHAQATVPYYRERLGRLDIEKLFLDDDLWKKVPILARRDIQAAGTALLSTDIPRSHGKTHIATTSGSTGTPVAVHGTEVTQFFWQAFTLRHYLWHRYDLSKKIVSIRFADKGPGQYPEGHAYPGWGPSIAAIYPTGPAMFLWISTPIPQQVEWLLRVQPDYLITYPSNLAALLEHCQREEIRIPSLRNVQSLAEVLPAATRHLCRDVWGVGIVDIYSSQEVGYLALQCPDHEHFHVQSENVLLEVLDANGNACKPGETGRVVVTTLHNFAMPLIRYAIGDYATVGEPCPCGRGLPVLDRIMGRARNMLTLPTGEQVWPYFGGDTLPKVAPIRQYQLIQKSLSALELRIVSDAPFSSEQEDKLRHHINSRISVPFEIAFSYPETIMRGAGGKYEDFRSELAG